jgi:tRNA A-37 threonylcarbamoyl transferase component Bud32
MISFEDQDTVEYFKKEIKFQNLAASKGISPKIVKAKKFFNYGIIVMEKLYVTLEDVLKFDKDTRRVADLVGDCLKTLHSLGIYHNDAHYQNFMLGNDKKIKIIDFGYAKEFDHADPKKIYNDYLALTEEINLKEKKYSHLEDFIERLREIRDEEVFQIESNQKDIYYGYGKKSVKKCRKSLKKSKKCRKSLKKSKKCRKSLKKSKKRKSK